MTGSSTGPGPAAVPPSPGRLSVFVTVGMGPWPFDRLLAALAPVCAAHEVFAQTGTSSVTPPCEHAPFLGYDETLRRIAEADVVITHGGNTVRLVQRAGKVPIAVAREAARGEMRNDHQVVYLSQETARGRVVVLDGSLSGLAAAVDEHLSVQARLLSAAAPLGAVDEGSVVELLDREAAAPARGAGAAPSVPVAGAVPVPVAGAVPVTGNPFARDPMARYRWAFDQLSGRRGRHLDLGVGDARFLRALHESTGLEVVGVDPHGGYLAAARDADAGLRLVRARDELPFAAETYDSVTMLDVLEHTADESRTLREVARVLRPGGLLVVTVPARHVLSVMDPDNAKFRFPRVHRAVYSARFGAERYRERFIDAGDGLRGDMAWERGEHTNYRASDLLALLTEAGFVPRTRDGANLLWRFFQIPSLLAPERLSGLAQRSRLARLSDAALRADGRWFRSANLFVTATRAPERPAMG